MTTHVERKGGQGAGASGAEAGEAEALCPCVTPGAERAEGEGRRAVAVDPELRNRNLTRLRRIEGQVRGLQRMVEEDRYCADIITQISSVQAALSAVGRELMRNHLKHCATAAIRAGDEAAEAMYDEIIELMHRSVR